MTRPLRLLFRAVVVALVGLLAVAAVAQARLLAFQSPSRNITCVMRADSSGSFAQCELRSRGRGYMVPRSGRVSTYQVDPYDDLASECFTLGYGQSRTLGVFRCRSRQSGMTCSNSLTAHGFTLSRTRQRVF